MSKRALPILLVLLAACGPKVLSQVRVQLDPLPADHEVKIFASDLPQCSYEEVGIIGSQDLDATLKKARQMGADGVIGTVLAESEYAAPQQTLCGAPTCVQYNTVAIRFADPQCTN